MSQVSSPKVSGFADALDSERPFCANASFYVGRICPDCLYADEVLGILASRHVAESVCCVLDALAVAPPPPKRPDDDYYWQPELGEGGDEFATADNAALAGTRGPFTRQ